MIGARLLVSAVLRQLQQSPNGISARTDVLLLHHLWLQARACLSCCFGFYVLHHATDPWHWGPGAQGCAALLTFV